MPLLGGVAWMTLTVAAICVFVQALQRRTQAPRAIDCRRINTLLRWLRRNSSGIWFRKLVGLLRIVGVSDAAFRAQPEDASGLALRGCVILLNTDSSTSPSSPDGLCNVLEYVCRRIRRVVRSTYSGELNSGIDTTELALLIQMAFFQIWYNPDATATQMAQLLDNGQLMPPVDIVGDARSVFDSIAAIEIGDIQESSLRLHLLSFRERIMLRQVARLWWTDTRDMLADGLTKGSAHRGPLINCCDKGVWKTQHPTACTWAEYGRKRTAGATHTKSQ